MTSTITVDIPLLPVFVPWSWTSIPSCMKLQRRLHLFTFISSQASRLGQIIESIRTLDILMRLPHPQGCIHGSHNSSRISAESWVFRHFANFLLVIFPLIICWDILYILTMRPLLVICINNISSHYVDCLLILFLVFFIGRCS